jgi:glucose-6-phosphate 1-dehydrogenase
MEDPLVCVGDCLPEHGLLLLEAIHGRKNWFLDFEEVRTAWKLVDPIQTVLADAKTPLHLYAAGSEGPDASKEWIEKEGLQWF